jgi:hypothetical protein
MIIKFVLLTLSFSLLNLSESDKASKSSCIFSIHSKVCRLQTIGVANSFQNIVHVQNEQQRTDNSHVAHQAVLLSAQIEFH